jgi:CRP-like cAMP-binding protein
VARPDPRKLKDDAAEAVTARRWKKAVEAYETLEQIEPQNGMWPQKVGEMYKRLDDRMKAVDAFGRAADRYSKFGFLVKAIAVCKLILEIDPRHHATQEKLGALHAATGHGAPPPPPAQALRGTRPPLPPPLPPIADTDFEELAPDAHPAEDVADPDRSTEIPLDLDADIEIIYEPEADAAATLPEPQKELARDVLPRTPLFSSLDEVRLVRVIDEVRLVELAEDQVVFRRGDPGDALYVIAEGEVVVLASVDGSEREVGRLGDGAFFGEIALLTAQPRGATVKASAPTRLLALDRSVVAKLCIESPDVVKVLLRFVRERLLDTLVETSPLFAPFSGEERESLVKRFRFLQFDPGARVLEEGKRAPGLFLFLTGGGTVTVERQPIAEVGPGDLVGEMSLLTRDPAAATVTTLQRSIALELPRADFQDVIMTHPQVLEYASQLADERRKLLDAWRAGKATYQEGRLRLV